MLERIFAEVEKGIPDIEPYRDCFDAIRNNATDRRDIEACHRLRGEIGKALKAYPDRRGFRYDLLELNKQLLCYAAYDCFDDFLMYVEIERPPEKQFYMPRRCYLLPIVKAYQEVADGKLKLLTVSLPKRAGKSQTGINFINWMSGRFPDRSSLMEGSGDALVNSFYQGCKEYLELPNEYSYYDVFPETKLVQTNADIKILNLNERSRFPTIMCRSIDSTQVGLSEATNVLYLDDCVQGREEAMNRGLLDKKWEVISGDVIGRALEGTPIVAAGTRYSLYDPVGRLQDEAKKQGWNWKAIEIPALDLETDESNYEFFNPKIQRKVFTTEFLREQRDLLSKEQWESEFQQQPFEAKGILFPEDALLRYKELPDGKEPDSIIAIGDTAESGSDSTAMGVFYLYGDDVYVADVVFDNSTASITKPQCARKIMQHNVSTAIFECNGAGEYYGRDVEKLVKEYGGKVSVRTKRTISNKQTRIEFASDGIMKHFYFKDASLYSRNSPYAMFLRELVTYTREGKVTHDDAPDMLSLAENELRILHGGKAKVMKNPFSRFW